MRVQDPVDHFVEYYIKELDRDFHGNKIPRFFPAPEYYEVAKFTGKQSPDVVYRVQCTVTGRLVCDCCQSLWSPKGCKHVKMVSDFRRRGKPATFPQFDKEIQ